MNDLEIVSAVLGVDEDDAFTVLELCNLLDQQDSVAAHGYPKDSPRTRDLETRLRDPAYRARLRRLAEDDGLPDRIMSCL